MYSRIHPDKGLTAEVLPPQFERYQADAIAEFVGERVLITDRKVDTVFFVDAQGNTGSECAPERFRVIEPGEPEPEEETFTRSALREALAEVYGLDEWPYLLAALRRASR